MRICLICVEIFAWGKYGGFGRATRMIGRELVKRGVEVTAVVPRRNGQQKVEILDGIRVLGFERSNPLSAIPLFREANADIYHSEEPSLGTFLAKHTMPDRKHLVTFRDPRDFNNWRIELRLPSLNSFQVLTNWLYEDNFLVRQAVRQADGLFAASHLVAQIARQKYGLDRDPLFLPTPVEIPSTIEKASNPTVCFVARLDRRKRPEIFYQLAESFPEVHFIAAGKGRDMAYEQSLRTEFEHLPNLEILGFVNQFNGHEVSKIFEKSWILVNPAAREGLPTAFIEAAAHGCAILSAVDPDGFTSRFGCLVKDDNFGAGLAFLLDGRRWEQLGRMGHKFVQEVFSSDKAMEKHLEIYNQISGSSHRSDETLHETNQ